MPFLDTTSLPLKVDVDYGWSFIPLNKCFHFSHKGGAAPKKAGKPAGKGRGKPAKKDESSEDEEDDDDDIQEVAVVPKLAAKKVKLVNFKLKPLLVKLSQF